MDHPPQEQESHTPVQQQEEEEKQREESVQVSVVQDTQQSPQPVAGEEAVVVATEEPALPEQPPTDATTTVTAASDAADAAAAAAAAKPGKADAEAYLNDVKRTFAEQPQIYHDFVDLMKSFKAGAITTQNIIEMVAALFAGYPDLIDRFNQFSGYKPPTPEEAAAAAAAAAAATVGISPQHMHYLQQQQQQQPYGMYAPAVAYDPRTGMPLGMAPPPMMAPPPPQQQQQPAQSALPQFDHAIHYVTRIKKRFAHDPETYKLFLDILHTYQKESKSVNDVLSEVSELFRDHPDLLKDFAYFLPEGTQNQTGKEEGARLGGRRKREMGPHGKMVTKPAKPMGKRAEKAAAAAAAAAAASASGASGRHSPPPLRRRIPNMMDEQEEDALAMQQQQLREQQAQIQQAKAAAAAQVDRAALNSLLLQNNKLPAVEEDLFNKIKAALGTRAKWGEFIRCVELFSNELLTRAEFIALVLDLLQFCPELVVELDRVLAARGVTDEMQEEGWFSVPLSEIDFTDCAHVTPSYRSLPEKYPKPLCSERTQLCRSVLNDTHVGVAIDIEFGSRGRYNTHEDNLFKIEDDRFEMEMLIEAHKSTIYALEQFMNEKEICFARFSTIHLRAISRMYGPEGSLDAFESLKKCPKLAIPVILLRLKQTLTEMELQKVKLQEVWRGMDEKNYPLSKDHRSATFKRDDGRAHLNSKTYLNELREYHHDNMELELTFTTRLVHRHAYDLIATAARRVLDSSEMDMFAACFERFAEQVLHLTSLGGKELTTPASLRAGTLVWTKFGKGEMLSNKRVKLAQRTVDLASLGGQVFEYVAFGHLTPDLSTDCVLGRTGYLFLRYYHVLCERLAVAMTVVPEIAKTTFASFMSSAMDFVAGDLHYDRFEERIRLAMGKNFYMMMTLDKLVDETFKAFQHLVDDDKASAVLKSKRAIVQAAGGGGEATQQLVSDLFRAAQDALVIKLTNTLSVASVDVKLVPVLGEDTATRLSLRFSNSIPQILTETAVEVPVPFQVDAHVLSVFTMQRITTPLAKEVYAAGNAGLLDWWKPGGGRAASASAAASAAQSSSARTNSPIPDTYSVESEDENSNSAAAAATALAAAHRNTMLSPRIKRLRTED